MKFTHAGISALKSTGERQEHSDREGRDSVPGLIIRVSSEGDRKSWTLRYRNSHNQQRRYTLGSFPELSVAEARKLARGWRIRIRDGEDPSLAKKQSRLSNNLQLIQTLEELWEHYRENEGGNLKKSSTRERSTWNVHLVKLADWRLTDITKSQCRQLIKDIGHKQGHPTTANRVHSLLHRLLNIAVEMELISINPATGIKKFSEKSRERVLSDKELQLTWSVISDTDKASEAVKIALKLLLLTGQRRGEVASINLSNLNIDEATWLIPDPKNSEAHKVPLSAWAVRLVKNAESLSGGSDWLFPSPRTNEDGNGASIRPEALTRAWGRIRKGTELEDINVHDFRRTVETRLCSAPLLYSRFDAALLLNHQSVLSHGVGNIYDQADYTGKKRAIVSAWADELENILCLSKSNASTKVVHIHDR